MAKKKGKSSNWKSKKPGKKKYRGVEIDPHSQKILMLGKDDKWYEWSIMHIGRQDSQPPEAHVGFVIIDDAPVTQAPYTDEYVRFVRLQWTGLLGMFG